MRLKEVLTRLPGITKAQLQYWEDGGYIKPVRIAKQRIERRDYGTAFAKIKLMWQFYQQGLSPEDASRQAEKILKDNKAKQQKLDLPSFFRVVETSSDSAKVCDAKLTELGTLNAPSGEHEKACAELFFASDVSHLTMAAKKIAPYLIGIDCIVVGDELGALIMGACSIIMHNSQPEQPPLLLQQQELKNALKTNTIVKGNQCALIFGFLKNTEVIEKTVNELISQGIIVRSVFALASQFKKKEKLTFAKKQVQIVAIFNESEVKALIHGTKQKYR